MTLYEMRENFETTKKIYDCALLTFHGVDGFDVYNCSCPFDFEGKTYIYGRVERRDEWATSWVYLFEQTAQDTFTAVPNSMIYQLEDPYITFINGELIMGGTHVVKKSGKVDYYLAYFYKGKSPHDMRYFTSGPKGMKDIRLIQLGEQIGVFSRPSGKVGFCKIGDISELTAETIASAPICDLVDGYGGINQCYALDGGTIGTIGHDVYHKDNEKGQKVSVYVTTAAVFDPNKQTVLMKKIIATRDCFPPSNDIKMNPAGWPLDDITFPSGIVKREDGKADLYSGLSDAREGRAVIDWPFRQ